MKNLSLTLFAFAAALTIKAQTTQVDRWVNTMGGNNTVTSVRAEDNVKSILEDGQGNEYVIGNYTGTITFQQFSSTPTSTGHSTGTSAPVSYNSVSGSQDVFLARYDVDGNCTWSASIGGAGLDEGNSLCMSTPLAPADFYITGMFNQSMAIGANTLYTVASGYAVNDAFIIRYNTSFTTAPAASWWRAFGGFTETCGTGIVTNGTNVFITGYFTDYVFDPDSPADLLCQKTDNTGTTGSTFTTTTPGYMEFPSRDMFVARYSTAGAFSDALNTYRADDQVEGHGIALSFSGSDLYVVGTYKGTAYFTTSSVPCSGQRDIFVAKYPQGFSNPSNLSYPATVAVTAGGPSTVYQSVTTQPPYKQDEGYAITATNYGVFIAGRFMDKINFGALPQIDPSGSTTETYMYLARYDANLVMSATLPSIVTGADGYSEARGIYGVNGSVLGGSISAIFVTGGAISNASVNGTFVETNTFAPEQVGFMARIGYKNGAGFVANASNFVDGLAQNNNGLNGSGVTNINVCGFGISYRVGCGVRAGGRFSAKTFFGNHERTALGLNDGFLLIRDNTTTITSSLFNCGSSAVTLTGNYTGAGTAAYTWTIPPSTTPIWSAATLTVTPSATTTYQLEVTGTATCPTKTPVTVYNYTTSSAISAGPDKSICGATHSVIIGTPAVAGATYSWAPSGSLSNPAIAQPTATVSGNVTYTMTVTDKCGNVSTDQVVVNYDVFCPHRMMSPEAEAGNGNVSIYPNPGNGSFTVEAHSSAAKTIQVFDMMGKLVFAAEQTTENIIPIDITEQPAGIYMVRIVTGNSIETQKLIKQ
ncbi:MAG: T9SS type A sorting domain-containing protein [Bacteroidia bacterium]